MYLPGLKRKHSYLYADGTREMFPYYPTSGKKISISDVSSDETVNGTFAAVSASGVAELPPAVEHRYYGFSKDYLNIGIGIDSNGMNMNGFQPYEAMDRRNMFMGSTNQNLNTDVFQYHPQETNYNAQMGQYSNYCNFQHIPNVNLYQSRQIVNDQMRLAPVGSNPLFQLYGSAASYLSQVSQDQIAPSIPSRRNSAPLTTDARLSNTGGEEKLRKPFTAYNIFFSYDREIILALLPDCETCNKSPLKIYQSNNSSSESKESVIEADVKFYKNVIENTTVTEEEVSKIISIAEENSRKKLESFLDRERVKKTHRKSHGKIGFQTLSKLISRRWNKLTENEKAKFHLLAKKDRARYDNMMRSRMR